LAADAIDSDWQARRVELDALFSPTVPPLDRLRKLCDFSYRFQKEIQVKYGRVLGCPLFALGAEICTQEDQLRKKIEEILHYKAKYLESAIRDADALGLIQAPDPAEKAQMILAYYEGLLTQARIQNDVEVLREAAHSVWSMLGVKESTAAAA
jgi:TetR/AcrR family transcriptional repressor of nem operon